MLEEWTRVEFCCNEGSEEVLSRVVVEVRGED